MLPDDCDLRPSPLAECLLTLAPISVFELLCVSVVFEEEVVLVFLVAASAMPLASQVFGVVVDVDSFRTSRKRSQLEAALSLSSVTAPIVAFLGE